jgi:hypothetical protein
MTIGSDTVPWGTTGQGAQPPVSGNGPFLKIGTKNVSDTQFAFYCIILSAI